MPRLLIPLLRVQLPLASPLKEFMTTDSPASTSLDSLGIYLKQIGEYPLLTVEEEIELSRIIQNSKDEQEKKKAIDKLVVSNLRLVPYCIKNFRNLHNTIDMLDVIQEGNKRLQYVAGRYDYEKHKTKFNTFAIESIRRNLFSITATDRFISIPRNYPPYMGWVCEMRDRGGYDSIQDIKYSDFKKQEWIPASVRKYVSRGIFLRIKKVFRTSVNFLEDLHPYLDSDEAGDVAEYGIDSENIPQAELQEKKQYLETIISETLNSQEADIVNKIFYKGMYMPEAGKAIGVSKQRISICLQRALYKLKARIVRDKKDFAEIPEKWIMVMEGKIKPVYRRSRKASLDHRFESHLS